MNRAFVLALSTLCLLAAGAAMAEERATPAVHAGALWALGDDLPVGDHALVVTAAIDGVEVARSESQIVVSNLGHLPRAAAIFARQADLWKLLRGSATEGHTVTLHVTIDGVTVERAYDQVVAGHAAMASDGFQRVGVVGAHFTQASDGFPRAKISVCETSCYNAWRGCSLLYCGGLFFGCEPCQSQLDLCLSTCQDTDGDGIIDVNDNCVFNFNPGQEDCDGDGIGDVCDPLNGTESTSCGPWVTVNTTNLGEDFCLGDYRCTTISHEQQRTCTITTTHCDGSVTIEYRTETRFISDADCVFDPTCGGSCSPFEICF